MPIRAGIHGWYHSLALSQSARGQEYRAGVPVVRSNDEPGVGARMGPYVLEEELGRGATATVFRASRTDGTRVALKILHADVDPVVLRRFERESEVAAGLDHPYLVPVLDHGLADGRRFLATRLASKGTLATRLENGSFPWER